MSGAVPLWTLWIAAAVSTGSPGSGDPPWAGVWSYNICHEDHKSDHENEGYCRQSGERIEIEFLPHGTIDITFCPADPWGERNVRVDPGGRELRFRTREGYDVHLVIQESGRHFQGVFRSVDGHSGRLWGRRVQGCR